MNIDISEIDGDQMDSAREGDGKPVKEPRSGSSVLAFFALFVALAALMATAWMWWQGEASSGSEEARAKSEIARLDSTDSRLSAQVQALREAFESQSAGDSDAQVAALQDRLSEDQTRLAELQQTLQEQVMLERSLQSAVDDLHARLLAAEAALASAGARELDARGELDLAEVDYLLRLASERLQLFGDSLSADRALALADAHLAAFENPAYLGVRQAIAAARSDLGALDMPDEATIAGQLAAIQEAVPGLPFRPTTTVRADSVLTEESSWWEKLKATLSSLVTVRRSTDEENRRISLQDQDYIRQRVWLQVDIAYLALMRQDQEAFHASLQRARASVVEWFDPESSEVKRVDQSLATLLELEVAVSWPDISEPWTMLQLVRANRPAPVQMPAQQPAGELPGVGAEAEPASAGESREGGE